MDAMDRLLSIMARLREPGGCPWDREQTAASLRTYVLEEAYEVTEAIDEDDWAKLGEELGDLLLQVVFLARVAEERGAFRFEDVARGIGEKLVRRHPHVFADATADDVGAVWKRWEAIKAEERAAKAAAAGGAEAAAAPSRLDGIPRHMPALPKARLLADKAARAGFDWPAPDAIVDKIVEEADEVRAALGDPAHCAEEIGDLLFATASLARRVKADPEAALEHANRKFARRFRSVEAAAAARGVTLESLDAGALDALWNEAKRSEGGAGRP